VCDSRIEKSSNGIPVAAFSILQLQNEIGSIEVGKKADLVL
jgi:imidazolonepropionase-like amidohydrolase